MEKSICNLAAVTRVGLDLAKNVFQVHAVDACGEIVAEFPFVRLSRKAGQRGRNCEDRNELHVQIRA